MKKILTIHPRPNKKRAKENLLAARSLLFSCMAEGSVTLGIHEEIGDAIACIDAAIVWLEAKSKKTARK
jgi:hypothetical protein